MNLEEFHDVIRHGFEWLTYIFIIETKSRGKQWHNRKKSMLIPNTAVTIFFFFLFDELLSEFENIEENLFRTLRNKYISL